MERRAVTEIEALVGSRDPDEVRAGLALARGELAAGSAMDLPSLFDAVAALFYIDPLDRPDFVVVLDEAISLVAGFGDQAIPMLVERLDGSDLKAQLAVAHALGRIGPAAIAPLVAEFAATTDPERRSFVLYALGKIRSPEIVAACPAALEGAAAEDHELRDTGTRALGKLAESIPAGSLPDDLRLQFVERLQKNLADRDPAIRAKAVRSLGKLARFGHLGPAEKDRLRGTLEMIAGRDARFDWDTAFVVRREAEEALRHV